MIFSNQTLTNGLAILGLFCIVGTLAMLVLFVIASKSKPRPPRSRERPTSIALARLYDAGFDYIKAQKLAGADVRVIALQLSENESPSAFDDGAWVAIEEERKYRDEVFQYYNFRRLEGLTPDEAIDCIDTPEGEAKANIRDEFEAMFKHYNPGQVRDAL